MRQKEKQPLSQTKMFRIWIKLWIWLTMYVNVTVPFVHIKVQMQVLCIYKQAKKKKSTEKVIEMNKSMNILTNNLEDCWRQWSSFKA